MHDQFGFVDKKYF